MKYLVYLYLMTFNLILADLFSPTGSLKFDVDMKGNHKMELKAVSSDALHPCDLVSRPLTIGARYDGSNPCRSDIDDFRVYDRELAQFENEYLYEYKF